MQLTLHVLGGFAASIDDTPVEKFYSEKIRALLIYLAVEAQTSHRRTALAGLLWPDSSESKARQSLRQALRQLRKAIRDDEADPPFLTVTADSVQLNPQANYVIDLAAIDHALAHFVGGGEPLSELDAAQYDHLQQLLRHVNGTVADGFHLPDSDLFNEWLFFKREAIQQQVVRALQLLADYALAQSAYGDAETHLQQWLAIEPWQEAVHRRLMQLYLTVGDQSRALAQYESCRQVLEREFAVEPAAETQALLSTVLAERQVADPTPGSQGSTPQTATHEPGSPLALPAFLQRVDIVPLPDVPFVARQPELAQLHQLMTQATAGSGTVAMITGGAGHGKSALLLEFMRQAQAQHTELIVAMGTCSARVGLGDPLLPFREILDLLTGDVEALWSVGALSTEQATRLWQTMPFAIRALVAQNSGLLGTLLPIQPLISRVQRAVPTDTPWLQQLQLQTGTADSTVPAEEQAVLFTDYVQLLVAVAERGPLLLVIDDMQWGDAASIELLFHLTRQLRRLPILLLIAYRDDEVMLGRDGERHPLAAVVNETRRLVGEHVIDLATDDAATGRAFVNEYLDSEPNQLSAEFRAALYHHTTGHPLFTVELLRNLQETGTLVRNADGAWVVAQPLQWGELPARVEAVIEERIARLDASLRNLLTVASVEGEEFTVQVLAQIEEIAERTLIRQLSRELDRQHQLVAESHVQTVYGVRLHHFRFRHILYQQHLYRSLNEIERSLLHGDVGQLLEDLYGDQAAGIAPRLAWHFAEAEDAEKAIDYLLLAGDQARRLYAYQDAINHYRRALDFLRDRNETDRAARTWMKLGLTYHIAFDFQKAREAYDAGFALWQQARERSAGSLPVAPHPLRVALPDPLTLDPGHYTDDASADIIYRLFSGLVQLSSDMSVVPDVAQRWEVLDGGQRYLFHLRNDVRWSDGVPVTAHDFVYAWQRVLLSDQTELKNTYLFDLRNARAFHEGDLTDIDAVGVSAVDDVTLAVELEAPTSYLPQLLTVATMFPVPRHVVEVHQEQWTAAANLVTNGPFRLAAWQAGHSAVLERNPTYHGHFAGNVTQVELAFDEAEPTALFARYRAGELDTFDLTVLSPTEQERARQQHADEYIAGPLLSTTYLGFDIQRAPFNDVRVRRAFAHAINQEALTGATFSDVSFPAFGGLIPPGMPGHGREIGLAHDAALARQLLAEAGYGNGQFPPLEALVTNIPQLTQRAAALWSQWFNTFGIDITWTPLPWDSFRSRVMQDSPHLWIIGWSADYPDPDNFLRLCDWQTNCGWEHYGFEQLVEAARATTDQRERMELCRRADEILMAEAPIVPLIYKRFHRLVKPWVTTFPTSPVIRDFWREVVIEPHSSK